LLRRLRLTTTSIASPLAAITPIWSPATWETKSKPPPTRWKAARKFGHRLQTIIITKSGENMQPPRMENDMSIYAKLADARAEFHGRELKKSGHNKFAGYKYFELADFVLPGMECLRNAGLVPVISFDAAEATMTLHEIDGGGVIRISSPMSSAALKGCHEVQNLGAVQTYLRRYLWTAALEIIEHDALDSAPPAEPEVVDLKAVRAALKAAPDDVSAKASEWIVAKYGGLEKMPPAAASALLKRLEAA